MTASTATQPPDKCHACGAKVTSVSADGFREFACGKMQRISDGVYGSMCHNAEAAAIALRAERDAALADVDNWRKHHEQAVSVIRELRARLEQAEAYLKRMDDNNDQLTHKWVAAMGWAALWKASAKLFRRNYLDTKSILKHAAADRNALTARLAELQAALKGIQEVSEEEIRLGKVDDSSIVWTLEANARAALASGAEGEVTK